MSAEFPFSIEHAKSGRSTCKDTKQKIEKGALRIGRWIPPREEGADPMTSWYSLEGFTRMLAKARTTKVENPEDISGYAALSDADQEMVLSALEGVEAAKETIKAERAAARKAKAKVKKEQEAKGSPAAKKTKKAEPKKKPEKPQLDPSLPTTTPGKTYKPREVAEMLLAQCRAIPDMNKTLPADDAEARKKLGGFILTANPDGPSTGVFDLEAAFKECVDGGVWKPSRRAAIQAKNPLNQPLVAAFEQYASYAFKESAFKGNNAMKATKAMAEVDFHITEGAPLAKGKTKLSGIGKSTAEKIDQFLSTGQIEALEAYKRM